MTTANKIASRFAICAVIGGLTAGSSYAQFSYSQNFDGMNATTTLPTNWVVAGGASPTFAGGAGSVTQTANTGSPTAGGTYNWGTTAGTDRAVGSMTSGSFASPRSYMVQITNTSGGTLTDFQLSYDLERYRVNTAAASVQFFYSTDGSTWTSVGAGDVTTAELPTGTSAYTFGSPLVVSKTATFNTSIASNANLFLRWNLNTTGSNSQGIGIDNVSLVAIPEPSTVALLGLTLLPGAALLRRRRK